MNLQKERTHKFDYHKAILIVNIQNIDLPTESYKI